MGTQKMKRTILAMKNTLECSICLDVMTNPVLTKCQHQFCNYCITKHLDEKPSKSCPLCKETFTKRSLKPSHTRGNIIDSFTALVEAFHRESGISCSPPGPTATPDVPLATPEPLHTPVLGSKKKQRLPRKPELPKSKEKPATKSFVEEPTVVADDKKTKKMQPVQRAAEQPKLSEAPAEEIVVEEPTVVSDDEELPYTCLSGKPKQTNDEEAMAVSEDETPELIANTPSSLYSHCSDDSVVQSQLVGEPYNPVVRIVCTGLGAAQRLQVLDFAEKNNFQVLEDFDYTEVTHLIANDANNSRRCPRTLKYLQAMASHCWVVSFTWVMESLERNDGKALPEEKYEMTSDSGLVDEHNGPRRSRLEQTQLFADYVVTCIGSSEEMRKGTLMTLVEIGGGVVVEDPWMLTQMTSPADKKLIIRFNSKSPAMISELELLSSFYKHLGIRTVNQLWVVDTLASYSARSVEHYLVVPHPDSASDSTSSKPSPADKS